MNLNDIKSNLEPLSKSEKLQGVEGWSSASKRRVELDFSSLPTLLTEELKRQNITYEEMAIQIGVSLSTFKRLIARPANAKADNLHALLNELGITVWLEK